MEDTSGGGEAALSVLGFNAVIFSGKRAPAAVGRQQAFTGTVQAKAAPLQLVARDAGVEIARVYDAHSG